MEGVKRQQLDALKIEQRQGFAVYVQSGEQTGIG
jgi:hypothetical protein